MEKLLVVVITFCIGLIGFFIAKRMKVPASAMIGSLIAVGLFNILTNRAFMPREVKIFSQSIAGMFIGLSIQKKDLKSMKHMIKPIVFLLLLYATNTFTVGTIISHIAKIDLLSAWLGCISGGVSDVSLIAIDMNANLSAIVFLQSARLICTLCFFPYWIKFLLSRKNGYKQGTVVENESINDNVKTKNIALTITVALVAGYIFSMVNIPASSLIGALICVAIVNNTYGNLFSKNNVRVIAQICSGALVGSSLTKEMIYQLKSLILPVIILMCGYIIVNYVFAYITDKLGWMDYKTALFSACPAGVSDMVLMAGDLGADMKDTGVVHIARLIYSIAIMPNLIILVSQLIL